MSDFHFISVTSVATMMHFFSAITGKIRGDIIPENNDNNFEKREEIFSRHHSKNHCVVWLANREFSWIRWRVEPYDSRNYSILLTVFISLFGTGIGETEVKLRILVRNY